MPVHCNGRKKSLPWRCTKYMLVGASTRFIKTMHHQRVQRFGVLPLPPSSAASTGRALAPNKAIRRHRQLTPLYKVLRLPRGWGVEKVVEYG